MTDSPQTPNPDNDHLIALVRRLGNARGGVLTLADFCRETGVSPTTIHLRFGGWLPLRQAAGLPATRSYAGRGRLYTANQLLEWLQQAVKQHGVYITRQQFCAFAGISDTAIVNYFGNWRKLRAAARLPERPHIQKQYTEVELLAGIYRLTKQLNGRFPTAAEINLHGDFTYATYLRRYGTYTKLKQRYDYFLKRVTRAFQAHYAREREVPGNGEPGT